jgi:site-specific recombinase XerD
LDLRIGALQVRSGKGKKDRTVYLCARARCELIRYLRHRGELSPNDSLWTNQNDGRLKPEGLRQILIRRSHRARIDQPTLHDFRRTFAIESLRKGCDLITLACLMGHTSPVILQGYLALVDTDLQRTHARSSPVDHL